MTHTQSEAKRMHHAGLALFAITRILRENLDYIDMPGGCALSVRDQHGLMLAAEHLAEDVYTALESLALEADESQVGEPSQ